jgi:type VI protein secretion system component VasK
MSQQRRPVWWVLYAAVPLLVGMFAVEHQVSLSPARHKLAQVGIVLFIYGLVWLWLRANARRLLWSDPHTSERKRMTEARGTMLRSPESRFTPRQAQVITLRARRRGRSTHPHAKGRGIRKCSLNFDRRSPRW